ncbi:amidohydrolase [Aquaticitalea lipolytica]|uniref:Amidohydrolase n=2 Tax=Aquaticitalea lipolytica TaxID=1247562 RepID=A0A8J2TUL7_9FLAO|nr:amidohydrolase [Aquaticitalea lipolytica]
MTFFSITYIQAQKAILLENFNLIDGTGRDLQKNKSLLIRADTIHSIFNYGDKILIDDFETIDMSGKYLLPGLIDGHTHLATDPSSNNTISIVEKQLKFMLAHGITGVRDMGGDARLLSYLSRQALLDEIESPDIYYSVIMAGPRFYSRDNRVNRGSKGVNVGEAPWMQSINTNTNIELAIAKAKGTGAIGIKLYSDLNEEMIKNITEEARKQGMLVWAHAAIFPVLPSLIVNADVNALSHAALWSSEQLVHAAEKGKRPVIDTVLNNSAPKLEKLAILMAQKNIFLDPTVIVFKNAKPTSIYNNGLLATKIAFSNGVKLTLGTDRPYDVENSEEIPLIEEMEALVRDAHIPAIEVIKAATKNSADLLNIGDYVGTIETGKKANILVVDKNPLDDMRNLLEVFKVFKNGAVVKGAN